MKNLQDECLDRLGGTKFSPTPMIVFHMTSLLDGRVRETFSYVVLDRDHRFDKIMKNHAWVSRQKRRIVIAFFHSSQGPSFFLHIQRRHADSMANASMDNPQIAEGYALTSWHSGQNYLFQ